MARHDNGRVAAGTRTPGPGGRHRRPRGTVPAGGSGPSAAGPAAGGAPAGPRISRRRSFMLFMPLFVTGAAAQRASAATRPSLATGGPTMTIVAHQDDDLLFTNPGVLHAIQSGSAVRTVYLTAGDDGMATSYWLTREDGPKAAYALMAGTANSWTQSDAGVPGHPIPVFTLSGHPGISLAYLRLPDGNLNGSGFARTGNERASSGCGSRRSRLSARWTGPPATRRTR
jgi:GlcNAc-PI de-N-acetylase